MKYIIVFRTSGGNKNKESIFGTSWKEGNYTICVYGCVSVYEYVPTYINQQRWLFLCPRILLARSSLLTTMTGTFS